MQECIDESEIYNYQGIQPSNNSGALAREAPLLSTMGKKNSYEICSFGRFSKPANCATRGLLLIVL